MSRSPAPDVLVVGAGPVGLFLACCLTRAGIRSAVVDKRRERLPRSRSIGIHPPSLEMLARLALAEHFLERGVRVGVGRAFAEGRCLGSVSFADGAKPFGFVLSLQQDQTERILEQALERQAVQILRGFEFRTAADRPGGLEAALQGPAGETLAVACRHLVGCDGVASRVREDAGIAFHGGTYPDAYAMGDFPDRSGFGAEARVFLEADGLVESFPLPGGVRRWVMATDGREHEPSEELFTRTVHARTGHDPGGPAVAGVRAFSVQSFLAERFHHGRVSLAGDSAHVVSPIGGQGMNLGWRNAWDLAEALAGVLRDDAALAAYELRGRRRARRARRRAEFNMALGRPTRWPGLRRILVRALLRPPMRRVMTRIWTMRGL